MSGLRNAGSKWAHDEEAEADLEADYKSGALKYFIPPSAIRPQIPPGGPRGASAGEHRGKAWVYVLRGHGNHDVTSMADVICDAFCFPWWNEDVTGEDVLYNGEEAGAWKGFWDPYKDTPEYQVRPRVPCLFLLFTTSDAIQRISEDDDLLDVRVTLVSFDHYTIHFLFLFAAQIDGRVATVPEWDVLFPWPFFLTTKIEMKGDLAHLMEGYSQFIHCAYGELHDIWKLEPKNPPHKMYTLAIPCMSCVTMPGDAADTVQLAMKYRCVPPPP